MAVPTKMQDLSTLAASNSPTGTEAIGNSLDNYIRAHGQLIRSTNALASASIASASTVDVANADGESVSITGTTTITGLGTGFNGCYRELRFTGVLTLTHSSSLKLPGSTNITTAAGDILGFRCTGSGVWEMVACSRTLPTITGSLSVSGTVTVGTNLVSAGNLVLGSAAGSSVYIRPDGYGSDVGQSLFQNGQTTLSGAATFNCGAADTITVNEPGNSPAGSFVQFSSPSNAPGIIAQYGTTLRRDISFSTGGITFGVGTGVGNPGTQFTFNSSGVMVASGVTLGGGKNLSKITVSSAAPGVLADGELYLRY